MTALETKLTEALQAIGCLPLEFNGRARAIAQKVVTAPGGGWKDRLSPEQITKILEWAGGPTKEKKTMDGRNPAYFEEPEAKATNTETKQPEAETEKLFPENPITYLPPEIDMIPVTSSNILGFGHDGKETLRVWFKNGNRYDYVGATEDQFFALVNAESAGKAYNAFRKDSGIIGIKL